MEAQRHRLDPDDFMTIDVGQANSGQATNYAVLHPACRQSPPCGEGACSRWAA